PYSLGITKVTELNQADIQNHLTGATNEELLKGIFHLKSLIEKDASKKHIRLRFERLNNPDSNKIIANLMREIGKGMYSSKQRMIFELLQNADDSPGREKVEFHIDTNGDYFFVMHDGAPFSRDDVDAITSAAESTKRKDNKKTGYKGIGFKSVFTDSEEVWLKSGSYQFAFIRNTPLFEDFESFYFTTSDYQKYPGLVEDHRKKYQKEIESYDSSTDIPWQVIPIWQDNLPSEFSDSNFNNFSNPVQFALKVGEINIKSDDGYLAAIENIVKKPQFLLFLRNTSRFRSPKNQVTVTRTDVNHFIKIEKTKVIYFNRENLERKNSTSAESNRLDAGAGFDSYLWSTKETTQTIEVTKPGTYCVQQRNIFEYAKKTYKDIRVSNDAFSELNIGIRIKVEKNDLNEDNYHFVDLDGNNIETIPPKLASATETEISFGISLIDNRISPEIEYTKGRPKYSSLFTYLPMEDTRFQLPFLVNADFVPLSDRQRIQGDNLWNKYIMIKVAEKHIETLFFYANEFIKDNTVNESYLSLLLMQPLPEDDTAQQIIESYNSKYLEDLKTHEIVVNDNNLTQLLSDTIIDDSGLTALFGHNIFYEIIETNKRLPHSKLGSKYLKEYKYLDIEVIDLEKLALQITPTVFEKMEVIIAENSLYENTEFLNWLNKLVKYIPEYFGKIPFIFHNNSLFSIERLTDEDDAWLINRNTSNYEELINGLGYHTINLNLDKYVNINSYLNEVNGYLNDRNLAYDRIAKKDNLFKLPITTKINLVDFLQDSEFMVGVGK
ncbi:ATP-binding protein, partial [Flavobacteriales bacterium]|nr:ATP-binding protein [Flavobacteriales bacterium]